MATAAHPRPNARTEPGVSLARGPALLAGVVLLAVGLYFMYRQHTYPPFSNVPSGRAPVTGHAIVGIFGINGWTGMLTAVAGGLLLFGAAQHLLAKTMSLIVGVGLGAAAVIAAVSGDVLGLIAANSWTKVGWGVVALILLFNTLVPRRRRVVEGNTVPVRRTAVEEPVTRRTAVEEPVTRRAPVEEPVTRRNAVDEPPVTRREAIEDEPGARRVSSEPGDPAA